ncbi:hypothetical protein Aph02nite_71710 [Actinoplanes philippinensis]|uniref:Uncharacterized protein n=1 Tax=Actinoplanes philippinensis TaxID=35752 RepID=A0A1I2K2H0_9ACTN|nr:hypothetical protein [Actinoplanes philippinensis]GIE81221.1 hypothetical protein Aph02nite_71710 [Actinoplanes philippinensis]SFF59261.1 hypothetical protein SAMN05421541_114141 [Actinoplanes philippinensis]
MTETGWPLIPREVLPPPVPVAKRTSPRGVPGPPGGRQLSMFGAETTEPSPADLAGLLAGPGRLGRMGGTARVSVRVDAAWRVHVLVGELVARGLTATWEPIEEVRIVDLAAAKEAIITSEPPSTEEEPGDTAGSGAPDDDARPGDGVGDERHVDAGQADGDPVDGPAEDGDPGEPEPPKQVFEVRTAYSRRLNALARAWPDASAQLFLSGPRLRLWVAAAGGPRPGGWVLGLDPAKDRHAVEAALVRAGLAGRVSEDGRRYLISGARRLRRLAELVGERPSAAPEEFWPGGIVA